MPQDTEQNVKGKDRKRGYFIMNSLTQLCFHGSKRDLRKNLIIENHVMFLQLLQRLLCHWIYLILMFLIQHRYRLQDCNNTKPVLFCNTHTLPLDSTRPLIMQLQNFLLGTNTYRCIQRSRS